MPCDQAFQDAVKMGASAYMLLTGIGFGICLGIIFMVAIGWTEDRDN